MKAGRLAEVLSEASLRQMYCDLRLSIADIAANVGHSPSAVRSRMAAYGIARRLPWERQAVDVDPTVLRRLYVDHQFSLSKIAALLSCSPSTILRKLGAAGIETRVAGGSPRYERWDFSGDSLEKAYLIGFRIGDLHVTSDKNTVIVKCTSTRSEQIQLLRALFEKYGHVYIDDETLAARQRKSLGVQVHLNASFMFLVQKQDAVPDWVLQSKSAFFAFLAGYLDAEGYVQTRLPRGYRTPQVKVEVRSYDAHLLQQLADGLSFYGIRCPPARLRVQAGYVNRSGIRSNRALWGLGINRKASLRRLFEEIEPYLRHSRRRRDMARAWHVVKNGVFARDPTMSSGIPQRTLPI